MALLLRPFQFLWLVFLLTCSQWSWAQTATRETRPNIVWIIVDDMSANFSCYGETTIATPHVDRLAAQGTRFSQAFVTAPVCSPCRSALITGMYQTTIGAHHHRSGRGEEKINLPSSVVPLPILFQQAGYFTCIGDGLGTNESKKKKPSLGKTDYNFEWDPSMYDGADWSGRKAGQPFFMQVQLQGGKLRGGTAASAQQLSKKAQAEFGQSVAPEKVSLPPYYPRDPVLLRDWAAYLDAVRFTDQHVGKVVDRLQAEGLLENTVVIFMTDHGISHARGKQFLYNEGTHVPLIVRGPKVPAGIVRNDLVEHIDLAAISLAAANIPIPKSMQSKNVLAKNYNPREAVYAARDRCDETVERLRSVRTEKYLYIRNFYPNRPHLQPNAYKDGKSILKALRALHEQGQLSELSENLLFSPTRPAEELYAWHEDPWQIHNLAKDPQMESVVQEMRMKLAQWMTDTVDMGPETPSRYDSDMKVYLGDITKQKDGKVETLQKNIAQMKQWEREGK